MNLSDDCLRECDLFEEFSNLFRYSNHLKRSKTTTETLEALRNIKNDDNDSVYEKLQFFSNLAVIGMLFR